MHGMFSLPARAYRRLRNDGIRDLLFYTRLYVAEQITEPLYARIRQRLYRRRYSSAAPEPYDLVVVDAKDVNKMLCRPQSRRVWHGTYIRGGDWDINERDEQLYYDNDFEQVFDELTVIDLENYVFYRSVREHVRNDVPWEETEFYQWITDNLGLVPYYENEELIQRRLKGLDELCASIREDGYRTQRELQNDGSAPFSARTDPCPEYHEVIINIGRDGQFLFEEGRHRFCVAKALGLEIPVRIFVRHKQWQQKVASLTNELGGNTNVDHPDVDSPV